MLWVLKITVLMRRFFEQPKHMLKLMGKKIIAILRSSFLLIWPYVTFPDLRDLASECFFVLCQEQNQKSKMLLSACMKGATEVSIVKFYPCRVEHAQIQKGGRRTGHPHPGNHKNVWFLSITGPDPLKKLQSY